MFKNGCGLFGSQRTLKLASGINGRNYIFAYWYKSRKARSYLNNYWVQRGGSLQKFAWPVRYWTTNSANSAVHQEWIDELNVFFACRYKFRKAKNYFNSYYVGVVKNGHVVLGHGTFNKLYLENRLKNWPDSICWWKSRKGKNNCLVGMVEIVEWLLGCGTPKSVVSQACDELGWFFVCW